MRQQVISAQSWNGNGPSKAQFRGPWDLVASPGQLALSPFDPVRWKIVWRSLATGATLAICGAVTTVK